MSKEHQELAGICFGVKIILEGSKQDCRKVNALLKKFSDSIASYRQISKCSIVCPSCKEIIEFYDTGGTEKIAVTPELLTHREEE